MMACDTDCASLIWF